jgi:hypothetical protein
MRNKWFQLGAVLLALCAAWLAGEHRVIERSVADSDLLRRDIEVRRRLFAQIDSMRGALLSSTVPCRPTEEERIDGPLLLFPLTERGSEPLRPIDVSWTYPTPALRGAVPWIASRMLAEPLATPLLNRLRRAASARLTNATLNYGRELAFAEANARFFPAAMFPQQPSLSVLTIGDVKALAYWMVVDSATVGHYYVPSTGRRTGTGRTLTFLTCVYSWPELRTLAGSLFNSDPPQTTSATGDHDGFIAGITRIEQWLADRVGPADRLYHGPYAHLIEQDASYWIPGEPVLIRSPIGP